MEQRFGVRDLILCVLLLIVIVSIWLAMVQFDRQRQDVLAIRDQLRDQTGDLAEIRRMLAQGVPMAASGHAPAAAAGPDPFARVRAAQEQPDYQSGDYFIDSFGVTPDRITPLTSTDAYGSEVQSHALESLARRDPETLEFEPLLATGWRVSDDGLRIEFDVRRGVVFSDGHPMNADDIVWTYNWIMNPEVEAPRHRAYYQKIASVEKIDDYTVAFTFKEPYFESFELAGGMEILPRHFYSQFEPSEFNRHTGLLMGTGPYRMPDPEGWRPEPGKAIEMVRNDRYWGALPAFEKLIWRVIENDVARYTTFINGDLDLLSPTPDQYQKMLQNPELLSRTKHFEYQSSVAGYSFIAWNQKRQGKDTIFSDPRVRRAMTLLTDRQRIIDEIRLGYAVITSGPFNPLSPQSNPAIEPWPFDVQAARTLLREVGFEDRNKDGVLESSSGEPFRFALTYYVNNPQTQRMVLLLKDTFARAGILLEPEPREWAIMMQRMNERDFDAITLGWTAGIESDPYQIFHSSQIAGTADNFISYANPELDAIIEKARSTVDEEERMPLWHQVHSILHKDQPYTFLMVGTSLVFLDKRIANVERTRLGLNPIYEWYVPRTLHKWAR